MEDEGREEFPKIAKRVTTTVVISEDESRDSKIEISGAGAKISKDIRYWNWLGDKVFRGGFKPAETL